MRSARSIRAIHLLAVSLLSLLIAACGSADEAARDTNQGVGDAEEEQSDAYRVILAGAATDTLSGGAVYGFVYNPRTGSEQFVVKLATGVDFVGGVFVARGNNQLPEERTYQLANVAEQPDSALGDRFMIAYQEGLVRQLDSRDGSVTFTHVSDTLIAGTIEATLRGLIAPGGGGQLREDEVHLSGRFEAERGIVGFIVGL
ncbi:MAG TPA: hypothetical protein VF190_10375 [Rhodothermales bacterium]